MLLCNVYKFFYIDLLQRLRAAPMAQDLNGHCFDLAECLWLARREIELSVKLVDHSAALIGNEHQHAVDLQQTDSLDKSNKHSHAGKEQRNYSPCADEEDLAGIAAVQP